MRSNFSRFPGARGLLLLLQDVFYLQKINFFNGHQVIKVGGCLKLIVPEQFIDIDIFKFKFPVLGIVVSGFPSLPQPQPVLFPAGPV